MLNREKILLLLDKLNLPKDKYALGTSGSLVLFGVKDEANDLDIDCDSVLYDSFLEKGYKERIYYPKEGHTAHIIDLSEEIQLIRKAELNRLDIVEIDGVSVYTVEAVRRFKEFLGREKDLRVIELIDKYLGEHSNG